MSILSCLYENIQRLISVSDANGPKGHVPLVVLFQVLVSLGCVQALGGGLSLLVGISCGSINVSPSISTMIISFLKNRKVRRDLRAMCVLGVCDPTLQPGAAWSLPLRSMQVTTGCCWHSAFLCVWGSVNGMPPPSGQTVSLGHLVGASVSSVKLLIRLEGPRRVTEN